MIRLLGLGLFAWLIADGAAAAPACQFERVPVGGQKLGAWIDKGNWLAIENQRLSLQAAEVFMPAWRLAAAGDTPPPEAKQPPLDDFPALDPLDGRQRDLGFLLDSRLYADGLVVMRNGRLVAERYRNGLAPDKPRLLLEATRPLLNLLGAISVSQGKLAANQSLVRYLPKLAGSTGVRKLSIQRLLEGGERYAWGAGDLESWRRAAGWNSSQPGEGVRAWLAQAGRWDKPVEDSAPPLFGASPEDDLLAWALAESNGQPLSRLFCRQLLSHARPEHPVLWASDAQGNELAGGLALSLRDFVKLGQYLLEARSASRRGVIPRWFIETLLASAGIRSSEIDGLAKGSELRYGFMHLGGAPNRVALIGAQGTSLYLDFDKRLVIALYATRPGENSPASLALLEQFWNVVEQASQAPGERRKR